MVYTIFTDMNMQLARPDGGFEYVNLQVSSSFVICIAHVQQCRALLIFLYVFLHVFSENFVSLKIEGASYVSNKEKHNDYLWFHPYVAKKRFINLYSTGKFD